MYNSDSPIHQSSQDLLKRSDFAAKLAESLLLYQEKESLCIGLLGPWGSGKTSLVNLIINHIEEKSQRLSKNEQPIILQFNPWNFTSSDQLLQQFFKMIADQFSGASDAKLNAIGDAISNYGSALELIPRMGGALSKGSVFFGNSIKKRTLHGADVASQRKRIIELLNELTCKVIIAIDDIDRLSNCEIQLIFKLVASVANFPNTIFLLSFDKSIVVRALDNYQGVDGNKYLEKIIQVTVNVPPVSDSQIHEIFYHEFEPLITQYPQMVWSSDDWEAISPHVFSLINNIRDISRLSNTVQLKLNMIGDEINFSDLIMITTLELKKPVFFEWIRSHKGLLVEPDDGFLEGLLSGNRSKEQWKEQYWKEFSSVDISLDPEECDKICSLLFPLYASRVHEYRLSPNDTDGLVRDQRIGHQDKFDRYFVLTIGDGEIPRDLIKRAVEQAPVNILETFIENAVEDYNPVNVVTEIIALARVQTGERSKILLAAMLKSIKFLKTSNEASHFSSAKGNAEHLCIDLMEKIGKDTSFTILKSAIETADVKDLEGIAYLLNIMLISYERIRENQGYPQLITEEQLNKLGKIYINQVQIIDSKNNVLKLDDFQCISLIRYIDEKTYNSFLHNKIIASDLNKLMILAGTRIGKLTGSDGDFYTIDNDAKIQQLMSDSDIDESITNCIKDKRINQLSEQQALKVAAYSLRESDADVEKRISEEDCYRLLNKWGYSQAELPSK